MNIDDAGGLLITTKTLTEKEKVQLQNEWFKRYSSPPFFLFTQNKKLAKIWSGMKNLFKIKST